MKSNDENIAITIDRSDDRIHLLISCLMWGGIRELLGPDLHDRALIALKSVADDVK